MTRFYRFMILALVGFAIGGGIAVLQQWREAQNQPTVAIESEDGQVTTDLPTAVAVQSAAEAALHAGAHDVVGGDADADVPAETTEMAAHEGHAAHDMAGHEHENAQRPAPTDGDVAAAVAGSSVGGAFDLTDHNGQAVTDKSWPGKYTLVFFGFTHCPDVCPAALDKMTAALETLGADTEKLQPLFITIDPARDDAATMKTYLEGYHPSILGLTGTEAQIKQAENGYKVYAAKVEGADAVNYTMAHSSYVFLMSPDGELLEIFRDADPADAMASRIRARVAQ